MDSQSILFKLTIPNKNLQVLLEIKQAESFIEVAEFCAERSSIPFDELALTAKDGTTLQLKDDTGNYLSSLEVHNQGKDFEDEKDIVVELIILRTLFKASSSD